MSHLAVVLVGLAHCDAGNQFQSTINLLYLAVQTQRVAILPLLQPIHILPESFARFSDFFDLDLLQKATGVALVEWPDLKTPRTKVGKKMRNETIACWSTMEGASPPSLLSAYGPSRRTASKFNIGQHATKEEMTFHETGLTPTYWPLPDHIRGTGWKYTPFECASLATAEYCPLKMPADRSSPSMATWTIRRTGSRSSSSVAPTELLLLSTP
jgi:hypothetical protein